MIADNLRTRELLPESSPDWQNARMLGRREALEIILQSNADDFPDEYQKVSSVGETGEFRSEWQAHKLAELLDAKRPESLIEHLDGKFWDMAAEIIEMRRGRDESRAELAAMRQVIKAHLDEFAWMDGPEGWTESCRRLCDGLAKLQPFIGVAPAPTTEGGAA